MEIHLLKTELTHREQNIVGSYVKKDHHVINSNGSCRCLGEGNIELLPIH